MKKRKKNNKNKYVIILLLVLILCMVAYYFLFLTDELGRNLRFKGFKTESVSDNFYKKIVTNNTLDDFYNDVAEKKDSTYIEYNFTKSSYDFIELKMNYSDNSLSTLNISSDIRNNTIDFNYEISNDSSRLMLDGNMNETFQCNVIMQENVSNSTKNSHCEYIEKEIENFITEKNIYLQDKTISEITKEK